MKRRWLVLCAVIFAVVAVLGIGICADGGAMASAYRTCECQGIEWERYDKSALDGPRRTVCVGWVRSRTCHAFRGGPEVPCDPAPA